MYLRKSSLKMHASLHNRRVVCNARQNLSKKSVSTQDNAVQHVRKRFPGTWSRNPPARRILYYITGVSSAVHLLRSQSRARCDEILWQDKPRTSSAVQCRICRWDEEFHNSSDTTIWAWVVEMTITFTSCNAIHATPRQADCWMKEELDPALPPSLLN